MHLKSHCVGTSHKALDYITYLGQISKSCTSYTYVAYIIVTYSYVVFIGHENYCIISLSHRYMPLLNIISMYTEPFPNCILSGVIRLFFFFTTQINSSGLFLLHVFQSVFISSAPPATELP